MLSVKWRNNFIACSVIVAGFTCLFLRPGTAVSLVQSESDFVRKVRVVEADDLGISNPAGLAFSPIANTMIVLEARKPIEPLPSVSKINQFSLIEDWIGSGHISASIEDPINMAFNSRTNRLLILNSVNNILIEIMTGLDGSLDSTRLTLHDTRHFGIQNPQGMAVDPISGHLFILDDTGPRIIRVEPGPDQSFASATISQVDLKTTGLVDLRGLAFSESNVHFYLLIPDRQRFYEITETGQVLANCDVSQFDLINPQAIVFAPCGDLTDDPSQMSLYIANSGPSEVQNQLRIPVVQDSRFK